jgi:cytochrome P450
MVTTMRALLGEAGADPSNAGELMGQFGQFVQAALIDPRRAQGPSDDPDDIVDLLVGAEVDGRGFTDQEIRQAVLALLNAGFETTYKTLAACLWHLAGDAAAWKALRSGAVPFEPAFEELLRLSAPVSVGRLATRDITVDGQGIEAGDWVLLCLPAANRDGAEFPDPESLVLSRQPNRHLTFGTGIHRCIGMHLARLELTVALQEALQRFERIWLPGDTPPTFSGSQAAGLVGLPLGFARAEG